MSPPRHPRFALYSARPALRPGLGLPVLALLGPAVVGLAALAPGLQALAQAPGAVTLGPQDEAGGAARPVDTAGLAVQAALAQLAEAAAGYEAAGSARDRVAALTRVVLAQEAGLAALRGGIRQIAAREQALTRALAARSGEVSRLLAALGQIERAPGPMVLLHPSGPLDAIRAGMLMAEMAPGLQARVDELRRQLDEIARVRSSHEQALAGLSAGLVLIQTARSELSLAISNRSGPARRTEAELLALAAMAESAGTLGAFAEALGRSGPEPGADAAVIATEGIARPLPVQGRLLRGFGAVDAAGITRPGWVIAARPQALVTAPAPATIRYLGPLLDYGKVMILEPGTDTLLVLAGLGEVYGNVGEVVAAGSPLGMMGGMTAQDGVFPAGSATDAGSPAEEADGGQTQTLYLELRKAGRPVDPVTWFEGTKDGTE